MTYFFSVGGNKTNIKDFPFIGVITYPVICGCTLVTSFHAITAAHCVFTPSHERLPTNFYKIRFGSDCHDRGGIEVKVDDIREHPNYDSSKRILKYDYDIAILKISQSLNNLIPSIGFANHDEVYKAGTPAWIPGWGALHQNEENFLANTRFLQSAEVNLLSFNKCSLNYARHFGYGLTDRMTCAGDFDGGVGTCIGLVEFV